MKKIFYVLLGAFLLSCSGSNDDIAEDTPNLQSEKMYISYFIGLFATGPVTDPSYFELKYSNGNLTEVFYNFFDSSGNPLNTNSGYSLFYNTNEIKIVTNSSTFSGYGLYTMNNGRIVKSEHYQMSSINQQYYLNSRLDYTYENDKIIVNEEDPVTDKSIVNTYYFNSDHNLIKSEEVTKYKGVGKILKTFVYSDFDNAKNPFKRLWFINYRKSLSANNYRKIQYTYTDLNLGITDPTSTYNYTYKYDSNGELLLYHPL